MKKKKADREVLREIFPDEIVKEVEEVIAEVDRGPMAHRKNPDDGKPAKRLKPWGKKWVESRKRRPRK